MSKIRSVQGLVVFITGAASGLGKGAAQHLIRQGARVVVADLPTSTGARLAEQLGTENALFTPLDVTKSDDVSKALRSAEERFRRLDVLVNCAALGIARAIYNVTDKLPNKLEDFDEVMNVNVTGTFNVMRLGVEFMHKSEPNSDGQRGVIVNTAGFAAYDGQQGQTAYAATNGAIVSMTLPASRDLARLGIRVVTICPGVFDTPLLAYLPERVRKYLADQAPSPPRLGRPTEFGHLVQHVIENSYLNGEVIRLDAGIRLYP